MPWTGLPNSFTCKHRGASVFEVVEVGMYLGVSLRRENVFGEAYLRCGNVVVGLCSRQRNVIVRVKRENVRPGMLKVWKYVWLVFGIGSFTREMATLRPDCHEIDPGIQTSSHFGKGADGSSTSVFFEG
jgi:hypothetical protein